MEKLSELVDVLTSLKKVSKKVLKRMLPIMKEIDSERSDIVDEVVYRTKVEKDIVLQYLQNSCILIIADAEIVSREITSFAEVIEKSQKDIKNNTSKFPFLAEVWFGDTYDGVSKLEGLKFLLNELKRELEKTIEDWVIENAVDNLVDLKVVKS